MKLIIFDNGDPSVGIFPRQFEIECPFDRETTEQSDLDYFKTEADLLFAEFDSSSYALYDFEIEERDKSESKMYNSELDRDQPAPYERTVFGRNDH